jgi:hypothetical protein
MSDLIWTRTPPSKPGWYWRRMSGGPFDVPAGIVQVGRFRDRDGLRLVVYWAPQEYENLDDVASGDHVYFVHSYCAPVNESTVATTTYGERFAAIVRHDKVFGAQFHPERSAQAGALVLRNFLLVS